MTADEFLRLHGDESGIELDRGRVVHLPGTGGQRGYVCGEVVGTFGTFVKANRLGRAACGHVFVRTGPASCRGADFVFVSYDTMPADRPTPKEELNPPFELVVEVRRPEWTVLQTMSRAVEYTAAGVRAVVVVDHIIQSIGVFRDDELPYRFEMGDEFTLPDILPGFAVPVKAFFE
jgi:Uma2 family endonuclease